MIQDGTLSNPPPEALSRSRSNPAIALYRLAISSSSFGANTEAMSLNPFGARSSASCMTTSGPCWRLVLYQLRGRLEPRRFVAFQGRHRIRFTGERLRQRRCIENALRRAIRTDGIHRMRGVAEQRHPAMAPPRHRVAVHHRKFIDRLRAFDERWNIKPVKPPLLECRGKLLLCPRAGSSRAGMGALSPPARSSATQLISDLPRAAASGQIG